MWERFCRAIDAEDLMTNPDYASAKLRSQNRDALSEEINRRLRQKPSAEWMEFFEKAEVPAGPIYAINEVFADPQVAHLKMAEPVESAPLGRSIDLVRQPVRLSRSPSAITVASPEIGEQTDEILAEFGYDAAAIAALRADGVV
jgi:formyl-CoA transferase